MRRTVAVLVLGGLVLALAGCGGGSSDSGSAAVDSVTNTTETLPTSDATTTGDVAKDNADAAVGDVVDSVTAAVNERMSQYTERELGSPSLGAEVRNCRKERDFSADSLLSPGGAAYFCEVWFEDELYSDDGAAVIDVDGNVASSP